MTPQLEALTAKGDGRLNIRTGAVNRRGKAITIGLSAAVLANAGSAGGIVITIDVVDSVAEPVPSG